VRIYSPQMSLTTENVMGGGVFDAMLLRHLSELGVESIIPLIFRRDHQTAPGWDVRVLPVYRAFKLGALLTNVVFLAHALWLWAIRGERFDVFRVQDPYYSGMAALIFRGLTRVPYYCHVHHLEETSGPRRWIERAVARRADRVYVLSEFAAAQARETLGVAPDRIVSIHPGTTVFDAPEDRGSAKNRLGFGDRPVLGFVGALVKRKNLPLLLDVLKRVRQRFPSALLVICGDDPPGGGLSGDLKAWVQEQGLTENVMLTGFVDNARKAEILRATDVFVFPSLMEGFGMAPVEAMALGVPAVVSDRGALPEIVEDGRTGYLADPADPADFADKTIRLIEDPALRDRMGSEAARRVREKFDWTDAAKKTLRMLEEIGKAATP